MPRRRAADDPSAPPGAGRAVSLLPQESERRAMTFKNDVKLGRQFAVEDIRGRRIGGAVVGGVRRGRFIGPRRGSSSAAERRRRPGQADRAVGAGTDTGPSVTARDRGVPDELTRTRDDRRRRSGYVDSIVPLDKAPLPSPTSRRAGEDAFRRHGDGLAGPRARSGRSTARPTSTSSHRPGSTN